MLGKEYKLLTCIQYANFDSWAVKSYFTKSINSKYPIKKIATISEESSDKVKLFKYPDDNFGILGVSNEIGMFDAYTEKGSNINQPYKKVNIDDIAYNPYRVNVGSIGIKTNDIKNTYISPAYVVLKCTPSMLPQYLYLLLKSNTFSTLINETTTGSVRQTLSYDNLANISIPVPPFNRQEELVKTYNKNMQLADKWEQEATQLEEKIEKYLFDELGIEEINSKVENCEYKYLKTILFSSITLWGADKNIIKQIFDFKKYLPTSFGKSKQLISSLVRGKSPKYSENSSAIILNQKCNRWNEIQLQHSKTVCESWLSSINPENLTHKDDILINSTGEGTIGRASLISEEEHIGLLYDSHMLLLRLNKELILPQFFIYLFNSSLGQKQVAQLKGAEATKQTELGVDNTKKIEFPLPPLDIQKEIYLKITKMKDEIKTLNHNAYELRVKAKMEFENEVFENE